MSTHLIYVIWLSSYFEESDVGGLSAPFLLPYTFWRIFVLFKHLLSLKKILDTYVAVPDEYTGLSLYSEEISEISLRFLMKYF